LTGLKKFMLFWYNKSTNYNKLRMESDFKNLEQLPKPELGTNEKEASTVEVASERNMETVVSNVKQATKVAEPRIQSQVQSTTGESADYQAKQIEDVLADGLDDYYKKMNPTDQKKFKETGEQAAREINTLLQKAVVKVNEIVGIIRKWLGGVPGLNKFFVEQSAKIKADKVLIVGKKDE
jgi:hypothetical protein